MANPVDLTSRVGYLPVNSVYRAWDMRPSQDEQGPGVAGYEDFRVLPRQSGLGMAVDVGKTGVGEMVAWVRGSTRDGQGVYRVDNINRAAPTASTFLTQITVDVPAAHASLPRLDIVVLRIIDSDHQGGATNTARVHVITGTATSGATLDNRTGAPAVPADAELLADILVPGGGSQINAGAIRDRRRYPLQGVIPPAATAVDLVAFRPDPHLAIPPVSPVSHESYDLWQSAALMWLPRRIVGATRIRWSYRQHGSTALAGNYVIGIYDASRRKIIDTGSVAFTGTITDWVAKADTITATTFEAGAYYVLFGIDSTAGGLSSTTPFVGNDVSSRNVMFASASGGATAPTTLSSFSDTGAADVTAIPVPKISLSVG